MFAYHILLTAMTAAPILAFAILVLGLARTWSKP